MVSNLITSSALEPDDSMPKWMAEYGAGPHHANPHNSAAVDGAGREIYRASLSRHFDGTTFGNVANVSADAGLVVNLLADDVSRAWRDRVCC